MSTVWLRITIVTSCILVASIATAALLVFLGALAYASLRQSTSPEFATAMILLAGIVVVAVALTAAYLAFSADRRHSGALGAARSGPDDAVISEIAGLLGSEVAQMIRAKPYAAALASLAAGFAVGAVPELRGVFSQLLVKR